MVMELLRGCDLATLVLRRGRLPAVQAVEYIRQACEAVAEAHDRAVIHRDIKPRNLFLAEQPNRLAIIKVLDFGVSKAMPVGHWTIPNYVTSESGALGSPQYMAPEQVVSARNVDARADVWSLGVVLYMLLTGTLPFTGKDVADTLANVVHRPPRPPQEIRPDIPSDVADIVVRCLRKDPKQRIPSAHALAAELSRTLARMRGMSDGTTNQQGTTPSDAPAVLDRTLPKSRKAATAIRWSKVALLAVLSTLATIAWVCACLPLSIRGRVSAGLRFESTGSSNNSQDASIHTEMWDAEAARD
jgi:serine/threonine-protein kinase